MNNSSGNKFFDGFLVGAIVGGAAVFLFGTRTGRNLVKIISEQGVDGLTNLLEEYDLADIDEQVEENFDGQEPQTNGEAKQESVSEVPIEKPVKKRFFHRAKK